MAWHRKDLLQRVLWNPSTNGAVAKDIVHRPVVGRCFNDRDMGRVDKGG